MRKKVSEYSQDAHYSHPFILIEWFVSSGNLIILPRAEVLNEGTDLTDLSMLQSIICSISKLFVANKSPKMLCFIAGDIEGVVKTPHQDTWGSPCWF